MRMKGARVLQIWTGAKCDRGAAKSRKSSSFFFVSVPWFCLHHCWGTQRCVQNVLLRRACSFTVSLQLVHTYRTVSISGSPPFTSKHPSEGSTDQPGSELAVNPATKSSYVGPTPQICTKLPAPLVPTSYLREYCGSPALVHSS